MLEGAHQLKGLLMLVEKSEYLDEWYGYLEFFEHYCVLLDISR